MRCVELVVAGDDGATLGDDLVAELVLGEGAIGLEVGVVCTDGDAAVGVTDVTGERAGDGRVPPGVDMAAGVDD